MRYHMEVLVVIFLVPVIEVNNRKIIPVPMNFSGAVVP